MADFYQKQGNISVKLNKNIQLVTPSDVDDKINQALEGFNNLPDDGVPGQVLTKTEDGSSWQTFSAKSNNIGYSETLPESVPEGFAENGLWISNDGDDENSFLTKAQVKALIQDEILKLGLNSLANSAKYEGSGVPSDSLGKDGDFYIQIEGKVN